MDREELVTEEEFPEFPEMPGEVPESPTPPAVELDDLFHKEETKDDGKKSRRKRVKPDPDPVADVPEVVALDPGIEVPEEAPKGVVYRRLPNGALVTD